MSNYLISIMIALPLFGALFLTFMATAKSEQFNRISRILIVFCSVGSSAIGILSVFSYRQLSPGHVLRETMDWIPSYAISYDVAIDGLNSLLILLISIVLPIIIVSEFDSKMGPKGKSGLLLIVQSSLLGLVCAQDLFLMFFFLTLTSVPFYFLMILEGEGENVEAAFKYIITATIGNAFIFASLVITYYASDPHTFSVQELLGGRAANQEMSIGGFLFRTEYLAFTLFCLGLGFRIPLVPIHGWFTHTGGCSNYKYIKLRTRSLRYFIAKN